MIPVPLSMPLSDHAHSGPVVRSFCQGLLPDNEAVLERWGRDFQVSAGNPFALLRHVGEDCAGAVQFARPAMRIGSEYRVEAITGRHWAAFAERNGLDSARIGERIDELGRRLPAAFLQAAATAPVAALNSDLPARLTSEVEKHVDRCRAAMAKT